MCTITINATPSSSTVCSLASKWPTDKHIKSKQSVVMRKTGGRRWGKGKLLLKCLRSSLHSYITHQQHEQHSTRKEKERRGKKREEGERRGTDGGNGREKGGLTEGRGERREKERRGTN